MSIINPTRVFIFCLIVAISSVGWAYSKGKQQDEVFLSDVNLYYGSLAQVDNNDFSGVYSTLNYLADKHPNDYFLSWAFAYSYYKQGNYRQAVNYMRQARIERPLVVLDPNYLYDLAEMLYKSGEQQEAKPYLKQAIQINTDPNITKESQQLLNEIQTESHQVVGKNAK